MKTIIIIILIGIVALGALSFTGVFCVGAFLGVTSTCITPLCNHNSTLFDDFCQRCRGVVDGARSLLGR